jgi:hypothetical protein
LTRLGLHPHGAPLDVAETDEMDRDTKQANVDLYDQTIAEAQSELVSLESSSQEFGRQSMSDGIWEDLKPREIARLRETIAEYETLKRELTGE